MEEKLEAMSREVEQLKIHVAAASAAGSTTGGSAGGAGMGGGPGGPTAGSFGVNSENNFNSTKVHMKGWVTNWDDATSEMLTQTEIMQGFDALLGHTTPEVRDLIDYAATRDGMRKTLMAKLDIRVPGGKNNCWDVRRALEGIVAAHPEITFRGQKPFFTVESSPQRQLMLKSGGRAIGVPFQDLHHRRREWQLRPATICGRLDRHQGL